MTNQVNSPRQQMDGKCTLCSMVSRKPSLLASFLESPVLETLCENCAHSAVNMYLTWAPSDVKLKEFLEKLISER